MSLTKELSPRIRAMQELCVSYHYQKLAEKLTGEEFDKMIAFIEDFDDLDHLNFEYTVNRMHLFKERSKNAAIIEELLISANSRVHMVKREATK